MIGDSPSGGTEARDRSLAGFGERAAAAMIDVVIVLAIAAAGLVPAFLLLGAGDWGFAAGLALAVIVVSVAMGVVIPAFMARAGERNGQSPGKQALEIRVVREDGEPVTFGSAFVREVVVKQGMGLWATTGLFALVDSLWPLFDDQNRAVHDSIADTRVVRVTRPGP